MGPGWYCSDAMDVHKDTYFARASDEVSWSDHHTSEPWGSITDLQPPMKLHVCLHGHYTCACIHILMYTIYIYIYIQLYVYIYAHTDMHTHTCIYVYVYVYTLTHVSRHKLDVHVVECIYIHMYAYTQTYVRVYVYTQTYTGTRWLLRPLSSEASYERQGIPNSHVTSMINQRCT